MREFMPKVLTELLQIPLIEDLSESIFILGVIIILMALAKVLSQNLKLKKYPKTFFH